MTRVVADSLSLFLIRVIDNDCISGGDDNNNGDINGATRSSSSIIEKNGGMPMILFIERVMNLFNNRGRYRRYATKNR